MASRDPRVATLEGVRPVLEALRAGRRRLLEVRLPDGDGSVGQRELTEALARSDVPHRIDSAVKQVEARAEPFPEETLEDLLAGEPPRRLVALDRVTDVGNLGSIARSAEIAGVGGLVLEHRNAPPIGAGALRASAGALEYLRVGRTPNLRRGLELARAEGLRVLVAEVGGTPVHELGSDLAAAEWVLVLGSEGRGTRSSIRAQADVEVGIPVRGRVGSLGVASAAAYLLLRLAELREAI